MSARRPLARIVVSALVSVAGIVGMLVARAPAVDALLLALAALPLACGWWRYRAERASRRN
jgi:hypothetical protein